MQAKWAESASKTLKEGREPTFLELAEFISDQADALSAMLMYQTAGRPICNQPTRSRPDTNESNRRLVTHTITIIANRETKSKSDFSKPLRCLKCNDTLLGSVSGF